VSTGGGTTGGSTNRCNSITDHLFKTFRNRRQYGHFTVAGNTPLVFSFKQRLNVSRKAWKMLKKQGTDAIPASRQKSITANNIASRLLRVFKTQNENMSNVHTTKMNLRRKKRTLTVNQTLLRNFSLDELETALMSLKLGKAAGFNGIHPEFIKNFVPQTIEWIISFMNDIVSISKIPDLFKRAKVISIIEPGKDGTDPAHYRPISLLSVVYKLLERLILQRIQPLI
jgi:hypothetical protein